MIHQFPVNLLVLEDPQIIDVVDDFIQDLPARGFPFALRMFPATDHDGLKRHLPFAHILMTDITEKKYRTAIEWSIVEHRLPLIATGLFYGMPEIEEHSRIALIPKPEFDLNKLQRDLTRFCEAIVQSQMAYQVPPGNMRRLGAWNN